MLKCNIFINIIYCVFYVYLNFFFIYILYLIENNFFMIFISMYSNLVIYMILIYFFFEDKIFKKLLLIKRFIFKVFVLDLVFSCL